MQWNLTDAEVLAACSGQTRIVDAEAELVAGALVSLGASPEGEPRPGTPTGDALLVAVPDDIERLRRDEPAKAARWRVALREALGDPMAAGARSQRIRSNRVVICLSRRQCIRTKLASKLEGVECATSRCRLSLRSARHWH